MVSGEPYQQRVVSLIPGNAQPPPWIPMPPPPYPPPFSIQQPLPLSPITAPFPITQPLPFSPIPPSFPIQQPLLLPPISSPYSIQEPLSFSPLTDIQQPWSMQPAPQRSPWPPIPWAPSVPESQGYTTAPGIWSPATPWSYAAPPAVITGPQESSSRDLDVGVYTGMDSPWTQLPPFTKSFNTAEGM